MVDNVNPSSQFHPYQPPDATPQSGNSRGILSNIDFRGGLEKARTAARNNPAAVLGGLAALAIGAGLMRRRAMR